MIGLIIKIMVLSSYCILVVIGYLDSAIPSCHQNLMPTSGEAQPCVHEITENMCVLWVSLNTDSLKATSTKWDTGISVSRYIRWLH